MFWSRRRHRKNPVGILRTTFRDLADGKAKHLQHGRILYQGSKPFLSHQWKHSALWELCGTEGPVDADEHGYAPLDR